METDYEIAVNDSVQIELDSNPTTGFAWKWTNKDSVTIVDTFDNQFIHKSPDLVVCSEKEIWKFKGIKSGLDTIKMEYCRPWDLTSTVSSKTITVKVK